MESCCAAEVFLLLMEEIQGYPLYLRGFVHPGWCRISAINSRTSSKFCLISLVHLHSFQWFQNIQALLSPVTPPGMKILSPVVHSRHKKCHIKCREFVYWKILSARQETLTPSHVNKEVAPCELENQPHHPLVHGISHLSEFQVSLKKKRWCPWNR